MKYIYTCIYTCIYLYIHICIYIYVYTYISIVSTRTLNLTNPYSIYSLGLFLIQSSRGFNFPAALPLLFHSFPISYHRPQFAFLYEALHIPRLSAPVLQCCGIYIYIYILSMYIYMCLNVCIYMDKIYIHNIHIYDLPRLSAQCCSMCVYMNMNIHEYIPTFISMFVDLHIYMEI
jgi:hypothetical protein